MPTPMQASSKKIQATATTSGGDGGVGKSATPVARKKKQQQQQQQQKTRQNSSKSALGAPCFSAASVVRGTTVGDSSARLSFSFIMEGERQKAKGESAPTDRELKDAFDFFDIDNDGRISSVELHKVLRFLGTKVNEEEVKTMIADVDTNGNGTVEFNEFLRMMRSYYHRHCDGHSEDAEMWEAFKAFDHNGDNYIDFTEIKKTMQFLGEEVTDADVKSMIKEADVDKDGRINFE
uniref:Calmodulin n=1 Tax=Macrostomum lignano TaxID=282301 RepID=A0A1I8G5J3_9PLAT